MPYTYKYPRPALTVDAVVFRIEKNELQVLLIKRKNPPFEGMWALPGGFVNMDETLEEAVVRELKEETGITFREMKQLKAYSAINRDPRHRTVSVAFWGVVNKPQKPVAGDDAANAKWFSTKLLPPTAFDHFEIISDAVKTFLNEKNL
jgi:8-oxo-dGTP diphosphatase